MKLRKLRKALENLRTIDSNGVQVFTVKRPNDMDRIVKAALAYLKIMEDNGCEHLKSDRIPNLQLERSDD